MFTRFPFNESGLEDMYENREKLKFEINKSKDKALGVIEKSFPILLPSEDTDIIIVDNLSTGAGYVGKWKGKHFILVKGNEKDIEKDGFKESVEHILVHELLHQKFVEEVGLEEVLGTSVSDYLLNVESTEIDDFAVAQKIFDMYMENPQDTPILMLAVSESISYLAEKYLGYDSRPLEERFDQDKGIYPEPAVKMAVALDKALEHSEIPGALEKILNYVSNNKEVLSKDQGLQDRVLQNPEIMLVS